MAVCRPGFPSLSRTASIWQQMAFCTITLKTLCPDELGSSQLDFCTILHHFQDKSVQCTCGSGYYQSQTQNHAGEERFGNQCLLQWLVLRRPVPIFRQLQLQHLTLQLAAMHCTEKAPLSHIGYKIPVRLASYWTWAYLHPVSHCLAWFCHVSNT